MGLRRLTGWGCGFESRPGNECLSVVSVVCCLVEVSATDQKSPWPTRGCCSMGKKKIKKKEGHSQSDIKMLSNTYVQQKQLISVAFLKRVISAVKTTTIGKPRHPTLPHVEVNE